MSRFHWNKSKTLVLQDQINAAFDRDALARICAMDEDEFAAAYDMETWLCDQPAPNDTYFFKDNGSDILAVAHLDTVGLAEDRAATFVDTAAAGTVVFSRALDDRLGAYIILDLLPKLGLTFDILLTVGEESGQSTAAFFEAPDGKDYRWAIEFDRGGTDVVMYQYDDKATRDLVKESGADVGNGSFSDIAYLGHLGIKAFNWGVGYEDYHGPRAHAYLDDTFEMVEYFLFFHAENKDTTLPHVDKPRPTYTSSQYYGGKTWSSGLNRDWGVATAEANAWLDGDAGAIVLGGHLDDEDASSDAAYDKWLASRSSSGINGLTDAEWSALEDVPLPPVVGEQKSITP